MEKTPIHTEYLNSSFGLLKVSLEEGSAPVWTLVGKMEWFSLQGLLAVWKCLLLCTPLLIPYLGEVGSLGPRETPSCNLQAFLFFLFFGCGVGG